MAAVDTSPSKPAAQRTLGDVLDVTYANPSGQATILIEAGRDVIVRGLSANGGGAARVSAGGNVHILGAISLLGNTPPTPYYGSSGGFLFVEAPQGDLAIEAPISVDGLEPGGDGRIEITVGGAISIAAGATISARTYGDFGQGGEVTMHAGSSITTAARVDASSDVTGGRVHLSAGSDITVRAPIDVTGYLGEGWGGDIRLLAGQGPGGGTLRIESVLYADGARRPDPLPGRIELEGCDVTVTSSGLVSARAPGYGGQIMITSRAALRVDGTVTAKAITSGTAVVEEGEITFRFPEDQPPTFGSGAVRPAPELDAIPVGGLDQCSPPVPTPTVTSTSATPTATESASPSPTPPPIECTGALEALDLGCLAQGPCTITRDIRVIGVCTLDLAAHAVAVGANRRITIGDTDISGNSIRAGSAHHAPRFDGRRGGGKARSEQQRRRTAPADRRAWRGRCEHRGRWERPAPRIAEGLVPRHRRWRRPCNCSGECH